MYSSVALEVDNGYEWLQVAVNVLFESLEDKKGIQVLWQLYYEQRAEQKKRVLDPIQKGGLNSRILTLSRSGATDLAFDDTVLRDVREVWQDITGETEGFMQFEDQEAGAVEDDEAY